MNTHPRRARAAKPGDILRQELEARGWTQQAFADIISRPVQMVNELITGKKSITPETAMLLSEAFGTSPDLWLNLQSSFQLSQLRNSSPSDDVRRKAALYQIAPVKEMVSKGWIRLTKDVDELEREIRAFYGVEAVAQIQPMLAHCRASDSHTPENSALRAWLQEARNLASHADAATYSPDELKRVAPDLRLLSTEPNQPSVARTRLLQLGIRLVFVPHLSGTYVDGAAFWLDGNRPAVAVSLRYNRIDNFWFTLMHELAHILLHGDSKNRDFIDQDVMKSSSGGSEREANRQAAAWLLSDDEFRAFSVRCGGAHTKAGVSLFAQELGIHPGIIVGRIHHVTQDFSKMRNIITPVCGRGLVSQLSVAA